MEFLIKLRKELKVPKGKYNSHGNFKYRSCEDILQAVKPYLFEHSLLLTLTDDIVNIGDRFYVKSTASITDGNSMESAVGFAREQEVRKGMSADQITGSTSSYARKYALNALFLLDESEMEPDAVEVKPITEYQAKVINDMLVETKSDTSKFLILVEAEAVSEIDESKYKYAIGLLNRKKEGMKKND